MTDPNEVEALLRRLLKPVFTFIDNNGENVHIDTDGLREWCLANKPEVFNLPLNYAFAATFIPDNCITLDRFRELSKRKHLDPIIMAKDGTETNGAPNCILVDGRHRFFLACLRKQYSIEGHLLEVEQWKPFQMHNLPSITKEQLRRSPMLKRNY